MSKLSDMYVPELRIWERSVEMKNTVFLKKLTVCVIVLVMLGNLVACGKTEVKKEEASNQEKEETEIQVFIAASLHTVMEELAEKYQQEHPNVKITFHADSSGTLLTQIQEGYECDLFFSAAQKQMDTLEKDGFVVEGTRKDVVNNQVVVLTRKDSGTSVTGLSTLGKAKSIAMAGGSVPVGKYTREALVSLGVLENTEDNSKITTEQIVNRIM